LSNFSYFGFQIEFPIFDDPASAIFNMLLGRDSDLFYFQADADVKLQGSQASPFSVFAMPIRYVGEADVKTHFKFAYDTYGFRHMLNGLANGGNSNPIEDLLNGFYIKSDSYFSVAGQIKAEAGQSIGLFGFSVDGGLSTGNGGTEPVSVVIVDPNQDGKLRVSEFFEDRAFVATGSVGKSSASSSEFGNVTRSVKPSLNSKIQPHQSWRPNPMRKGISSSTWDRMLIFAPASEPIPSMVMSISSFVALDSIPMEATTFKSLPSMSFRPLRTCEGFAPSTV
jgi:hypothetical protein